MKLTPFIIFIATFSLVACTPTSTPHSNNGGGHTQVATTEQARDLAVHDQGTDTEVIFAIEEDNRVFEDYGISHTKEMHLIVVRDDLQYFQHLHPKRDASGIWHTAFEAPAGGNYWHYADFVDREGNSHTIRFEKNYPGISGTKGIVKNSETEKGVDGYHFALRSALAGHNATFTYDITNAQGKHVQPEEYLGAMGHSVLISPAGDFIHTHPSEDGPSLVFETSLPSDDFYRVFTQFQIDGTVITVDFDWEP
ncbi:hypothetical protein A2635_01725 [Candidatus Peribacteria bacterium RIFCSPHIGHO2_01_FULL_51_9]|nr:MAG: hypothetical protein A2635_01725 [Candidatus Peribacteria bacterium RIFCSPHIGHO2_01_FULL_51_9]